MKPSPASARLASFAAFDVDLPDAWRIAPQQRWLPPAGQGTGRGLAEGLPDLHPLLPRLLACQ